MKKQSKNGQAIDLLSLSHFLNYLILGIFYKNNYKLIIILCIIWEIFEYLIANNKITINLLIKY
jgi:hypothetical protein